ncbi:MAG TPA: alpha/beta fold hydrolase [Flavobacteriia bacterium]|nr:alpha/beta fold hydrolase [Flavobacteriia bacterium]
MPVLNHSTYQPSLLFKNKHFNTVYRTLFNKYAIPFDRQRLELADGDFIDLDISSVNADKVVIAIHGLEGSSASTYILSLTQILNQHHFDVVAMNLRGCSGEPNRLLSSYHSGKTEDLEAVIQYIEQQYHYKEIHLVGYSLGGNLSLKYMGEKGKKARVQSAVGVSVPCDLKTTAIQMNAWSNRLYLNRFLKTLVEKSFQKLTMFPDSFLTEEAIASIKNFKDFDDLYTAPAHGFTDAEDYWRKSSCKQFIPKINKPTLLITSLDDPFFGDACYPFTEAEENDSFFMEATNYGGHVGFGKYFDVLKNTWCEHRILSFLTTQQ